jgi:hypothetical protein
MMMRRYLVLTDERARHPFLASLPPHVRQIDPEPAPRWRPFAVGADDVRQFLLAYFACLVAVVTYIW